MAYEISTDDIIEALRKAHGRVYAAAMMLHCTPQTIYNRINAVQRVKDALDDVRGNELDWVELQLRKQIETGNLGAIIFYLKTQGKSRGFTEKLEIDVNYKQLEQLAELADKHGHNLSDVFNEMIAAYANSETTNE